MTEKKIASHKSFVLAVVFLLMMNSFMGLQTVYGQSDSGIGYQIDNSLNKMD